MESTYNAFSNIITYRLCKQYQNVTFVVHILLPNPKTVMKNIFGSFWIGHNRYIELQPFVFLL